MRRAQASQGERGWICGAGTRRPGVHKVQLGLILDLADREEWKPGANRQGEYADAQREECVETVTLVQTQVRNIGCDTMKGKSWVPGFQ